MSTITTSQATKLNKSNRAAKDASLGTAVRNLQLAASGSATLLAASGCTVATATDATNARIAINTGLTAMNGFMVNLRSSGSLKYNMKATTGSAGAGIIVIEKDATVTGSAIAAGDVATWIAF